MLTAGVDLAAQTKGTSLAVIDWSKKATLVDLTVDVADQEIVEASARVEKLGVDCALGWPVEFVDFVRANAGLHREPTVFDGGMEWRRMMAYRETDRSVREQTGRWPLSVSTDRLGLTAMRCAGLLSRLQAGGIALDRSGVGLVVEVYQVRRCDSGVLPRKATARRARFGSVCSPTLRWRRPGSLPAPIANLWSTRATRLMP